MDKVHALKRVVKYIDGTTGHRVDLVQQKDFLIRLAGDLEVEYWGSRGPVREHRPEFWKVGVHGYKPPRQTPDLRVLDTADVKKLAAYDKRILALQKERRAFLAEAFDRAPKLSKSEIRMELSGGKVVDVRGAKV